MTVLLIGFLSGCASTVVEHSDARMLFRTIDRNLALHPSRSFRLHWAMKFMTAEDTSKQVYEVSLQRLAGDAFGYRIRANTEGFHVGYDGTESWMGSIEDSAVTVFREKDDPRQQIEGTFIPNARFPHIAGIRSFEALVSGDANTSVVLRDDLFDDQPAKTIEVRRVVDADIPLQIRRITVRLSDTIPMRITEEMHIADPMGTLIQYRDARVENLDLDAEIPDDYFRVSSLPRHVRVTEYVERSPEELLPLQADTLAPDFTASIYGGDSLRLSSLRGKVVFIDFWYVGCHPCQLAAPAIETMHEEFGRDGDVAFLGVNPVDKADDAFLKKFLESRAVKYPVLLADPSVPRSYKVMGYPTFFIIDRAGIIRWSAVGYAEGYEEEFRKELDRVLARSSSD
jgi:thiol-disulfide isomerase/thioredoxin